MGRRVVIVGGVAGGMSCAARLRRLDDDAEIVVFEKGGEVSFANCGMPYYLGGVIEERTKLLVQTAGVLKARFAIDVRVRHEVLRIDREAKQIDVKNLATGSLSVEPYDVLVLATGAAPVRPEIPGADGPNVFVLNDLDDMDGIAARMAHATSACVVGAGFIGLELVENFRSKGLEVHLVEIADQVLPPLDREMAQLLYEEVLRRGAKVHLNESVVALEDGQVTLRSGGKLEAGLVCLCMGVRPSSRLAREAGLELGPRGHIRVNARMQTSDPCIYAVGDVVEVRDFVTGAPAAVPLAGPANRQGRIAADNLCGLDARYRDTQGTAIVKVFDQVAACTGLSEKRLREAGIAYRKVYVHPTQRPRYYPGAQPIALKLLFSPEGAILGAQAVGSEGVDVLINILATAMRGRQTVRDLEHLELAYSPQWGGAKHPINIAGFVAGNLLDGLVKTLDPDDDFSGLHIIDCRTEAEALGGMIPGATLMPLDELRVRYTELPKAKPLGVYCAVGLRGYVASRFLQQKGFDVRNINGGYRSWSMYHPEAKL